MTSIEETAHGGTLMGLSSIKKGKLKPLKIGLMPKQKGIINNQNFGT
jgi:hypothetical protein